MRGFATIQEFELFEHALERRQWELEDTLDPEARLAVKEKILRKLPALELLVATLLVAVGAFAAPSASFTARPLQNATTCVAPCLVHFDAIGEGALSAVPFTTTETTDPDYTREFHSMKFEWDFGDPTSGSWTTGARSRTSSLWPKNYDIGGVAAHMYHSAGTYVVTLKVTNPAGQTSQTTRNVTVTAPGSHFSAANTFCFAPDDLDWTGCPLDCAGGDDNCTVTTDLDQALTAGDSCSGADDCANLDASYQRAMFRRGGTYSASTTMTFVNTGGVALIEDFGSGNRPIFDLNGQFAFHGEGFTYKYLRFTDCSANQCLLLDHSNVGPRNSHRFTSDRIYCDVAASVCTMTWLDGDGTTTPMVPHYLVGEYETETLQNGASFAKWPAADYMIFLGGVFDKGGNGIDASWRTRHMQHTVIAHMDFLRPSPNYEHWQLRSWSYSDPALSNRVQAEASRFVQIHDNWMELSNGNGFASIRICNDQGCNCYNGASCVRAVENVDFVLEQNHFLYIENGTDADRFSLMSVMCGGHTVRNNTIDMQGALGAGANTLFVIWTLGNTTTQSEGNCGNDNIHVYNNTLYVSDSISENVHFADDHFNAGSTGCDTDCRDFNNLVVWPSGGGATLDGGDNGWSSSNNFATTSDPFVGTMGSQGATDFDHFQVSSPNASIIDAGYDFSTGSDTNGWGHLDLNGNCRTDGQWDIGAHEVGAINCAGFAGSTPRFSASGSATISFVWPPRFKVKTPRDGADRSIESSIIWSQHERNQRLPRIRVAGIDASRDAVYRPHGAVRISPHRSDHGRWWWHRGQW